MRTLFSLVCTLSLITQLSAQSDHKTFRLNLTPGNVYQLESQESREYYDDPAFPVAEKKNRRYADFIQRTVKYQLTVLERSAESYRVQLVRIYIGTYHSNQRLGLQAGNYGLAKNMAYSGPSDTVRFQMDGFGKVIDQENPDSVRTAYAVPDAFRIETEVVMPEMIESFTGLLRYLHPESVSRGNSWTNANGASYKFVGERAGLYHLRSEDGQDLYIDPETNWLRFMEQHRLAEKNSERSSAQLSDVHQLVRGRVNAGQLPSRISGSAPSHKSGSFRLRITPYFMGAAAEYLIQVDDQGRFSWQDTIADAFFFQLTDTYENTLWGYAVPGGELQLALSEKGQWTIRGNTRHECEYLGQFFDSLPEYQDFLRRIGGQNGLGWGYDENMERFWQNRLKESTGAKQQLAEAAAQLDPEFVMLQDRQIDYFRACALNFNLTTHYFVQFKTRSDPPEIPKYYRDFLENQLLYNGLSYALPAFRALFHVQLERKLFSAVTGDLGKIVLQPSEPLYYFAQLHYQGYPLYQTGFDLLQHLIERSGEPSRVDHLYQHFQKIFTGGALNQSLEERYQKMQALQTTGATLPDLLLYDNSGQAINLLSLKGKPTVLVIVNGQNFWDKILLLENTHRLVPEVQFVFLHIGPDRAGPITNGPNIRHLYAETNSAAVADVYMQYHWGKHPRAYLLDRNGALTGTLYGSDHYSDVILQKLYDLEAGTPLIDKQSRQNILFILLGLLGGGLIIGLLTHQWQRRLRRREQVRRQQVETQLRAIRSQLNPHFMFNSMNSIQHLIRSGQSDRAQAYLNKLASLLRASLRHTRENFISLQEELEVVHQYCELEALRFNFFYELKVDRQLDTRAISIPPLLLQPYVENAVLHGIAPMRDQGKLKVHISGLEQQLSIRIRDNGPGVQTGRKGTNQGNGLGLKLNAERLQLVYGDAAVVKIYSPSPAHEQGLGTGTEVQITMPLE